MAYTRALKSIASQRGFSEVSGVDALTEKNKVSQEEHSDMQVLVTVYLHQTLCARHHLSRKLSHLIHSTPLRGVQMLLQSAFHR